jgi:sirohydrochlorin cobaltochelatase
LQNSTAYLLVIHGSRDPRPALALTDLAQLFGDRIRHLQLSHSSGAELQVGSAELATPQPVVGTASLECHPLPLHQQIEKFCRETGTQSLVILPLFVLPGVHVMEDIPQEILLAKQAIVGVEIQIRPYLGSLPKLRRLLNERMANQSMEAWVLIAHGSRRPGANQPIDDLAEHLGAVSAYWSVPPSLESRLQDLAQQGLRKIGILPYFLFAGGITDALARSVSELAAQHPELDLHLTQPLQASSELADLLIDLVQN